MCLKSVSDILVLMHPPIPVLAQLVLLAALPAAAAGEFLRVDVEPASVQLCGKDASCQLVITGIDSDGIPSDLTQSATYVVGDSRVARMATTGIVRAVEDGTTTVAIGAALVAAIAGGAAVRPPARDRPSRRQAA